MSGRAPRAAPVGAARLLQEPVLPSAQRALYRRDRLSRLQQRVLDPALHLPRAPVALAAQRGMAGALGQPLAPSRRRARLPDPIDGRPGARTLRRTCRKIWTTFALASQIVQAEAKKFFIESTRLRKWRTSGLLWWNVIDGWPQFSDAVGRLLLRRKARLSNISGARSSPVALIIGEPGAGDHLPVVICNDTLQPTEVSYQVRDADSGEVLAEGTLQVPANQNWQVARLRSYASDQRLYLLTWRLEWPALRQPLPGRPPAVRSRPLPRLAPRHRRITAVIRPDGGRTISCSGGRCLDRINRIDRNSRNGDSLKVAL